MHMYNSFSDQKGFALHLQGIQASRGFWIPRRCFRIPDTEFPILGFRITWSVFRIPKTKIHHFHKRKFPGFTNPDSLNYMGRTMGRLFPFPPIIQPQKASKCFSWQWQMEKIVNKINSFFKYIINLSFIDSGVRIKIQCQSFAGLAHQHNFQELLLLFFLLFSPFMIAVESRCGKKVELRVCLLCNSNDFQVLIYCDFF